MNYRHAFHAGNHADVLKHWTLTLCLKRLAAKPTAFAVLDTHAGRGLYDLASEEAQRSPEWRDGAGRVFDWSQAPPQIARYREILLGFAPGAYPGSPLIAAAMLRGHDRLAACELHPQEALALKHALAHDKRAQTHARDGYEGMKALTPFPEKRGLVLIDPPYERDDDLARAVSALKTGLSRFGHAVYLWWRPLKDFNAIARADAELAMAGKPMARADLAVGDPATAKGLAASSMLAINPPYGVAEAWAAAGPALAGRLEACPGGFFRVRTWLMT